MCSYFIQCVNMLRYLLVLVNNIPNSMAPIPNAIDSMLCKQIWGLDISIATRILLFSMLFNIILYPIDAYENFTQITCSIELLSKAVYFIFQRILRSHLLIRFHLMIDTNISPRFYHNFQINGVVLLL